MIEIFGKERNDSEFEWEWEREQGLLLPPIWSKELTLNFWLMISLQGHLVQQGLDVMHCKKIICENLVKTAFSEKDLPTVKADM